MASTIFETPCILSPLPESRLCMACTILDLPGILAPMQIHRLDGPSMKLKSSWLPCGSHDWAIKAASRKVADSCLAIHQQSQVSQRPEGSDTEDMFVCYYHTQCAAQSDGKFHAARQHAPKHSYVSRPDTQLVRSSSLHPCHVPYSALCLQNLDVSNFLMMQRCTAQISSPYGHENTFTKLHYLSALLKLPK